MQDQQSLGQCLKQKREAKKISIQQVAQHLRLSPSKIEAMESDDAELMNSDFARGYLRNYARLLQIDEQMLLDIHRRDFPELQQKIVLNTEALKKSTDQSIAIKKTFLLGLVALLIITYIGFSIYAKLTHPSDFDDLNKQALPSQTVDDIQTQSLDAQVVADDVKQQATQQELSNANMNHSSPMQQGQIEIKFVFSEQTWASVRDAEGRSIYNKLAEAGTKDVVYGRPPLKLIIGNVHGTKLYKNSDEISLDKFMQNNIARLNVE